MLQELGMLFLQVERGFLIKKLNNQHMFHIADHHSKSYFIMIRPKVHFNLYFHMHTKF